MHFDSGSFGIVGCMYCELRSVQLVWEEPRSGVACGMEMHVLYCTVLYCGLWPQNRAINQSINPSIEKRHQIARPELTSIPASHPPHWSKSFPTLVQHLLNKHGTSNIDTFYPKYLSPLASQSSPSPQKAQGPKQQGGCWESAAIRAGKWHIYSPATQCNAVRRSHVTHSLKTAKRKRRGQKRKPGDSPDVQQNDYSLTYPPYCLL